MRTRAQTVRKIRKTGPAVRETPSHSDASLINKLAITTRNPTKRARKLCAQLRKIFDPDGLTHLQEKHPRLQDFMEVTDCFRIGHVLIVSEETVQVGVRPQGPTYTFKIIEYDEDFKTYSQAMFKKPAFVTFGGESPLRKLFGNFGKNEDGFKRVLHVEFAGEDIFLRHYCLKAADTEDSFVMGYKEIGPRLTLRLAKTEENFYPGLRKSNSRKSNQ